MRLALFLVLAVVVCLVQANQEYYPKGRKAYFKSYSNGYNVKPALKRVRINNVNRNRNKNLDNMESENESLNANLNLKKETDIEIKIKALGEQLKSGGLSVDALTAALSALSSSSGSSNNTGNSSVGSVVSTNKFIEQVIGVLETSPVVKNNTSIVNNSTVNNGTMGDNNRAREYGRRGDKYRGYGDRDQYGKGKAYTRKSYESGPYVPPKKEYAKVKEYQETPAYIPETAPYKEVKEYQETPTYVPETAPYKDVKEYQEKPVYVPEPVPYKKEKEYPPRSAYTPERKKARYGKDREYGRIKKVPYVEEEIPRKEDYVQTSGYGYAEPNENYRDMFKGLGLIEPEEE